MRAKLVAMCEELRREPPGRRFYARYRACARRSESFLATAFYISVGAAVLVLGILFSFWPIIPGFIFVLAGLAMLSARWQWLARGLDRFELFVRRRVIPQRWQRPSAE